MRCSSVGAAIAGLLVLAASAGGEYTISQSVIGCGGGRALGADYQINGTVGQAAVGVASGPAYTNEIGFWYQPGWILTEVPEGEPRPNVFLLNQNRPNPFNPVTTVEFGVPERSHVRIRLYDVLGREVRTLVDDMRDPGYHRVVVDGAGLASGVYFCLMEAGSFVAERKLVLLK